MANSITNAFKEDLSTMYYIGRTRIGFKNEVDSFESMAEKGLLIIDKVVTEKYRGHIKNGNWIFKKLIYVLNKSTKLFFSIPIRDYYR